MKKIFFINILILFVFSFLISPNFVLASTLFTGSANQNVFQGQTFVIDWFIDTEGGSLNTVDLKIKYTAENLRAVEASTGNSLLSLWIKQPTVNQNTGLIELIGGAPNGFTGRNIPVFRTTFEAIKTGTGRIDLESSSKALKNDGLGTPEVLKFATLEFPIVNAGFQTVSINSSSHPDQNEWYKDKKVLINFAPQIEREYSYHFSSNLDLIPDEIPDPVGQDIIYDDLVDGIYYFKLNSKVRGQASIWEEVGVYRVRIDNTPPVSFIPEIVIEAGRELVSFSTVDKTSGISHYKVKVGLFSRSKKVESPYILDRPMVGDGIIIEAYDAAGNKQTAEIKYPGYMSIQAFIIFLILAGLGCLAWISVRKLKNKN